jgi:putative ABC transport system permease protein
LRALIRKIAPRNLRSDWFGTMCAIIGVALGTATVNVVLVLDMNTRAVEARRWSTNPTLPVDTTSTVGLAGIAKNGQIVQAEDAGEETHEDYQVMRSAIRLGSLTAFLTGALIVFFTFRVIVEQRRREIALLRSIGATPRQVAAVLFVEAAIVGFLGAFLGFVMSPVLSIIAAISGITTTGRAQIYWINFPWMLMLLVSAIGGLTALFGIARPLYEVLKLDVARTLRPQFLELSAARRMKSSGVALIALPFMALLYVLIRPFFVEILPSLAFFVLEAGLVCAGFLSMLVFVPELVRVLGGVVARLLPAKPLAPRLLTLRRIQRNGHDLAWAVSGVMLVFALLFALHLVTHALKIEVVEWAAAAIRDNAYVYGRDRFALDPRLLRHTPEEIKQVHYSRRTPWPNAVLAVDRRELAEFHSGAEGEIARRLGPGKVILSGMMSRRFGIAEGDFLEVKTSTRTERFEVVAVTDAVGYMPMIGPYRNSKTYALISSEDFPLIAPYTGPMGNGVALKDARARQGAELYTMWKELLAPLKKSTGVRVEIGSRYEADRVRETDRDFAIFDVILFLTGVLAAIGIANNLVLSAHARRREIALYRVLGMEVRRIRTMFMMEGAFIGLLGGLLAVVLGVPLGFFAIGALQIVSAFNVRLDLPPMYAVWTIFGALAVSLAASLYPARRAASLSGAESVHYE